MINLFEFGRKVAVVLFKNVIGIVLIPILFFAYYFTDSQLLQAFILLLLFVVGRVNIHGKRLHLIKSSSHSIEQ